MRMACAHTLGGMITKAAYNVDARKRAVNLTLNEDLLEHVREFAPNLSGGLLSRCSRNT